MKNFIMNENVFVMAKEPAPDLTIKEAEKALSKIKNEKELAMLFAIAENKAWWIEDEIYDYKEGTEEYRLAVEKTDLWFLLADRLRYKIFAILIKEGVQIPIIGQKAILEPFMNRNGYKDNQGWWVNI